MAAREGVVARGDPGQAAQALSRGSKNSDLTFVLLHGASKHLKRPTQGQPENLGVFGDT